MSTGLIFAVVILEKAICVRKLGITAKKKKKKRKMYTQKVSLIEFA